MPLITISRMYGSGGSEIAEIAARSLGWTLYDAGDLAGAETQFQRSKNDRVPQVRDSAQRGLTAIERRRTNP